MDKEANQKIENIHFLEIFIEMNNWEGHDKALLTLSGRDLYIQIAAGLLTDPKSSILNLKSIQGHVTDRSTRNRLKEFQNLGLVQVAYNKYDARTKRIVPTDKLISMLNSHIRYLKKLIEKKYILIEK